MQDAHPTAHTSTPPGVPETGLKKNAISAVGIVFLVLAAASPLIGLTGAVPSAMVIGNGNAAPMAYVAVGAILLLFGVGYVAMSRQVTNAGALYAYLTRTRAGRLTYAVGDNPHAARLLGVAIRPAQLVNFMIASVIAYVAGLVVASSVASVNVRVAKGTMIYDVILVTVLGGIGLSGGRGGVWGVVASTLLIGTLVNGMTLLNVSLSVQNIVRGVLLLLAVIRASFVAIGVGLAWLSRVPR